MPHPSNGGIEFKGMKKIEPDEAIDRSSTIDNEGVEDTDVEPVFNGDGDGGGHPKIASGGGAVSFDNDLLPPVFDTEKRRKKSDVSDIGSYSSGAHDYSNLSLYQVCRTGDVNALVFLLKRKATRKHINELDNSDLSPLHYCAKYNHYDCAELLVRHGAKANVLGVDNTTPLHFTAIYRKSNKMPSSPLKGDETDAQAKLITLFCKRADDPVNVDAKDRYGCTALHMASYKGNHAAVCDLLDCGADIECRDETDMTPLQMAASYGYVDICSTLLSKGANVMAVDQESSTSLCLAAATGHVQICRKLLEEAKARDASLVTRMLTMADVSAQTPLLAAVDGNNLEVVKVLIEFGAEVHLRNEENFNYPLHLAAQNGEKDMLQVIFDTAKDQTKRSDTDISNVTNKKIETPLHRAALFNRVEAVKFLLEHGANIDAIDDDRFSPLLLAASSGHEDVTELLLSRKADVNLTDADEKSILHWCVETQNVAFLKKVLSYKELVQMVNERDAVGNTPVHVAARNGTVEMVQLLFDNGGDLSLKNEDEQTSLHLAADYGRTRTVRKICELDDDLVGIEDENSNTALHLAATKGHEKVVTCLIEFQANVESRNFSQWTPLDCAAAKGWTRSARILLENDAPVDATDRSSITPLYLACENNHPGMVRLLLDWDASLDIRCSSNGKNPLDIAIESGSKLCVEAIMADEEWWNFPLQNRTAFNDRDEFLCNTPMRKLIRRMPEMAVKAFNNCIVPDKNHAPNDEDFKIKFIYEYIDDDYSMSNWLPEASSTFDDAGSQTKTTPSKDTGSTVGTSKVYVDADGITGAHVAPEARKYNDDTKVLIENHPLTVMVKNEAEHLLQHPLVTMLLRHKWSSFGRVVYYCNLLQFLIYLCFLTGYVVVTKPINFWVNETYDSLSDYIKHEDGAKTNYGAFVMFHDVGQWVVLIFAIFNFLKEVFQIKVYKFAYFYSGVNWVEMSCFILAVVLVLPTALGQTNYGTPNEIQWQCGAGAVFLSWVNLVLFIQKFPKFGIYVVMFTDILLTFFNFFVVFFLFVVAFAMGFYCLLQNQNEFHTVALSMIKTGVMMIGEFEYTSIFFENDNVPSGSWRSVTLFFFVVFAIVMSIIIMNLLVGLAVDDIKAVQDTAALQRMAMQVELALQVEHMLPEFIRKKFVIREEVIYPNRQSGLGILRRIFGRETMDGPTIMKSLNIDQEPLDAIKSRQDKMMNQLKTMENLMLDMQKSQTLLSSHISMIANKQGIQLNEDDYVGEVDDDEI